ncbi:MAG: YbbR-like domain-containing protein [Bacteriovoracaceae bacterium]
MIMKRQVKKHSLKWLSVFVAVFLWIYVLNSEKVKFEKTVLIDYVLPEDSVFSERPITEAVFLIEGPRAFVKTVMQRDDKLVIDLRKHYKHSNFSVDINPAELNLPFGMVVERVLPRKLPIKFEKKASKIVPLKLQFSGILPERLSLIRPEIHPAEVEVSGPRSLIVKLKELPVRPIELDGLLGHDEIPLEVQLNDDRISLLPGQDLKFTYELKASSSNFNLKNIPIKFLTHSKKVKSDIKLAHLKLLVPEKIIKNRSNISSTIQVWADIPENFYGKQEIPLKVILPPGIHLLEVTPKSIIVNIE